MAEVEWTGESTLRLMEEYKQRPELWDNTHDLYRVQTAKYEAWSDLARVFECDIADLRKKLNSIFASHRREKGKIRSGGRSNWFLYEHLSFLPNHIENPARGSATTVRQEHLQQQQHQQQQQQQESEKSEESSEEEEDNRQEHDVVIKQEPDVYVRENKTSRFERSRVQRITRPYLKRRVVKEKDNTSTLDSRLLETLRLLRKSDLSKKKDECDSFGEYIAVSLRKHDDRTKSMIKQAINNILFEQEMKKYSSGYTVVISGVDENPLVLGDDK